ncbi:MAG: WhiB family transcriptional regulator [Mycobacteriales bacterium]
MTRTATIATETVRRIRRDARFRRAVAERVPDPTWRNRGACLAYDPEVFFPNAAEDPAPAMVICHTCAVQGACLAAALDSADCDGVWGATTPEERRVMRNVWVMRS